MFLQVSVQYSGKLSTPLLLKPELRRQVAAMSG